MRVLASLALVLLVFFSSAQPAFSKPNCGNCPPSYCTDPAYAARLKAEKKRVAEARGLPARLSAMFDQLDNCEACIKRAPDWPHISWNMDRKAYKAKFGEDPGYDRISRPWNADTELRLREELKSGLITSFHIYLGKDTCKCCPEGADKETYTQWKEGEDIASESRDSYNEGKGFDDKSPQENFDNAGDVAETPKDLTEVSEGKRRPQSLQDPGVQMADALRLVHVVCPECEPLAEQYNDLVNKINNLRRPIAQGKRNLSLAAQTVDNVWTDMYHHDKLAHTPETAKKKDELLNELGQRQSDYQDTKAKLDAALKQDKELRDELKEVMEAIQECEKNKCKKQVEEPATAVKAGEDTNESRSEPPTFPGTQFNEEEYHFGEEPPSILDEIDDDPDLAAPDASAPPSGSGTVPGGQSGETAPVARCPACKELQKELESWQDSLNKERADLEKYKELLTSYVLSDNAVDWDAAQKFIENRRDAIAYCEWMIETLQSQLDECERRACPPESGATVPGQAITPGTTGSGGSAAPPPAQGPQSTAPLPRTDVSVTVDMKDDDFRPPSLSMTFSPGDSWALQSPAPLPRVDVSSSSATSTAPPTAPLPRVDVSTVDRSTLFFARGALRDAVEYCDRAAFDVAKQHLVDLLNVLIADEPDLGRRQDLFHKRGVARSQRYPEPCPPEEPQSIYDHYLATPDASAPPSGSGTVPGGQAGETAPVARCPACMELQKELALWQDRLNEDRAYLELVQKQVTSYALSDNAVDWDNWQEFVERYRHKIAYCEWMIETLQSQLDECERRACAPQPGGQIGVPYGKRSYYQIELVNNITGNNPFYPSDPLVGTVTTGSGTPTPQPEPAPEPAPAGCTGPQPLPESQLLFCPEGQIGNITQERTYSCVGTTWTPGSFQTTSNTCAAPPPPPPTGCAGVQPLPESQTLFCPEGQIGNITQERTYSCVGTTWTPGSFQTTSNTCAAPPPPPPTGCAGVQPLPESQTLPCPAGQTGSITQARTYSCLGNEWAPGDWQNTSNTCAAPPPPPPPTGCVTAFSSGNYGCSGDCGIGSVGLTVTSGSNAMTANPFGDNSSAQFSCSGSSAASQSSNLFILGAPGHTCTLSGTGSATAFGILCQNSGGGSCNSSCSR